MRAIRAVVPEELSREVASANARSAFTKALLTAFLMPDGKFESSTINLRIFSLVKEAASTPP